MNMKKLLADYGSPFLWALAACYGGVKGFSGSLIYTLSLPYYQQLVGASLQDYHSLMLFVMVPWAAKPLIGMLSDHVPLWGYRRRYYALGGAILIVVGAAGLAGIAPGPATVPLFILTATGLVVTDLLFEARYSETMSRSTTNVSGASIISFAWGLAAVGGAAGCLLGALMSRGHLIRLGFLPAVVPGLWLFWRVYRGGLQDAPEKAVLRVPLVMLAFILTVVVVACTLTLSAATTTTALITQSLCSLLLVHASLKWIPRLRGAEKTLAKCNVFLFLAEITSVRLTGATDYFFTAACHHGAGPGGHTATPMFSYAFYLGWMPILASVASLVGVWAFSRYLQLLPLRSVFCGVAVVRVLLASVSVCQAARCNVGYFDDKLLFVLSEGIVGPCVSMMYLLPLVGLTARLMPAGNEALTYGILAGYQNFGQIVATTIGLWLIQHSDVGHDCNFMQYPKLVIYGHIIAPLATIPAAFFLVPTTPLSNPSALTEARVLQHNLLTSSVTPSPAKSPAAPPAEQAPPPPPPPLSPPAE